MKDSPEQDFADFIEYCQILQSKLDDAVAQALEVDPIMGGLKAMSLYSTELQLAAAAVGHKLGLPHELAIAYLVSAEAISFEKRSRTMRFFMRSGERQLYKTHETLMKFVWPIITEMSNDTLSERFFSELTSEMERTLSSK